MKRTGKLESESEIQREVTFHDLSSGLFGEYKRLVVYNGGELQVETCVTVRGRCGGRRSTRILSLTSVQHRAVSCSCNIYRHLSMYLQFIYLDTGFSWFPCVYKQMLRWFPRFKVANTCFSCSPPDLNLLVTNFIFCIHVK